MPDKEIAASLVLNAEQANQSMKQFRTEIKVANAELREAVKQFGELSPQAIAAAKKVAELKDRIQDAKEMTDLFDPGAKFKAFGNVVRGVVGGFTALTGALALFGSESKEVEKAILKVQGALALTEGLNTIADVSKDFQRFNVILQQTAIFQKTNAAATAIAAATMKLFGIATTETATAFKVLKGAIIATGIGVLVAGIVLLISHVNDLQNELDNLTSAQKALNEVNKEAVKSSVEQRTELSLLYRSAQDVNLSVKDRLDKVKQLQDKFPGYFEDIKTEKDLNDKLTTAYNNATTGILNKAKATAAFNKIVENENKLLELREKKETLQTAIDQREEQKKKDDAKQVVGAPVLGQENRGILKSIKDQVDDVNKAIAELETVNTALEKNINAVGPTSDDAKRLQEEREKLAAKRKTQLDKELAEAKTAAEKKREIEKAANEQLEKLRQENFLATIEEGRKRLVAEVEQVFENEKKKIEALTIAEETKTQLIVELNIQRGNKIAEIDKKIALDKEAKDKEEAEKAKKKKEEEAEAALKLKEQQDELQIELDEIEGNDRAAKLATLDEWYKQRLDIVKGNEELEKALLAAYEKQKTAIVQNENQLRLSVVGGFLAKGAELFGKQTAAGKVLAIAAATIDTYQAANSALKANYGIFGPAAQIARFIAVTTTIATGLKNVREIAKTKVPGASGGAGIAAAPALSVSAAAPLQPQAQISTTQLDQQTLNNSGNATIRAYVNETDITNNQERITRLNRAARLGG